MAPVILHLLDQYDNLVDDDATQVTIVITDGPGAFTVTSTVLVTASNGIVTFDDLTIDEFSLTPYRLEASFNAGVITSGNSEEFLITAP
jgi:hypothetical protein